MAVKKVFLIYAPEDRQVVDWLTYDLEVAGVPLWTEHEQVSSSPEDRDASIERGISQCQAVIFVASPFAKTSLHVANELEVAERYLIPILPFWITGDNWLDAVPARFSGLPYTDARGDYLATAQELISPLAKEPTLPKALAGTPAPALSITRQIAPVRAASSLGRFRTIGIVASCLVLALASFGFIYSHTTRQASTVSIPRLTASATPPALAWAAISSPNPGSDSNELSGISVVDADDAWAAGFYQNNSPVAHKTLIERWNGKTWSMVPSPNPGTGDNFLASIAAVGAGDAWAVGEYQNGPSGASHTLIERWNGKTWSVMPSPNPGTSVNFLAGVAATDATHAWAAGFYQDGSSGSLHTLIEHWNGSAWSVVSSPNPGAVNNELYGIAAANSDDAWAVGYYQDISSGQAQTLIERWNGSTWSVVQSPNPGTGGAVLAGITALDAKNAWAAGYFQGDSSQPAQTIVEHWNGSVWSVESSRNPGYGDNELYSIDASDADNVWAVGNYQNGLGVLQTLIERWDGKAWSVVNSPDPGTGDNSLDSIAVVDAGDVRAVGEYHSGAPSQTLILHGST